MHELRSCDFCGADAAGTFEVVPPELEPTPDEQRRVALCSACRDRLTALVEPLVARARGDDSSGPGSSSVPESHRSTGASDKAHEEAPDEAPERESVGAAGPDSSSVDESGSTGTAGPTTSAAVTAADDEPDSGGTVAFTEQASDGAANTSDERTNATGGPASATGGSASPNDADGRSTGSDEASGPTESGRSTSPPPNYRKALRLLEKREFPMERSTVESLVASAYALEGHEVERIVNYAIARKRLIEDGDLLRRPT